MASDEAQVLVNWGIEGVNYQVVNGKRVIPPEEFARRTNDPNYIRETGVGLYVYPFPQRGDGQLDPTGNPYTPTTKDYIKQRYSAIEKKSWPPMARKCGLTSSRKRASFRLNLGGRPGRFPPR